MRRRVRVFLTFGLAFLGAAGVNGAVPVVASPRGLVLHVDASVSVGGDGSSAHPFVSPDDAIKVLKRRTPEQRLRPTFVILHKGVYPRREPLRMGELESGSAQFPVQWQAAGDGEVVFSGGIPIPTAALRPVSDSVTLSRLPAARDVALKLYEVRLSDLQLLAFPVLEARGMPTPYLAAWPELFMNGRPLPLASWPNGTGYAHGFKPSKIISSGTTAKVIAGGASASTNRIVGGTMAFAFANDRVVRWKKAKDVFKADVWMGGHWYWDWADDFLPVSGISDKSVITMGKRHSYGLGPHVNLHVYNLAEEMDAPGEYVIEPAQKRILVLLSPQQVVGALTLSWLGGCLVQLEKCDHIRFKGIRFVYGRSDGVELTGVSDVAFKHCVFSDLGRNGLTAKGQQITVEDCLFAQIGAAGIRMSGGDRKTLVSSGNRVSYCEFHDFSRLKRTYAPGVWVDGVGVTVENSLFYNAPHTAILFGGNEHIIRNNEIRAVLTETGDCGAIYGGRDWTAFGTVISGNWIHDLRGLPGRWPCGIYLDDQLSGITVKHNLLERMSLGILVGGGRYDRIEGNVLVQCEEGLHLDCRGTASWTRQMNGTLLKRLAEIPASQEPWRSRYPMLEGTLKNHPEKPVGTSLTGNAMVGCGKPWKRRETGGVATVKPNWEKLPAGSLSIDGRAVWVKGTPLTLTRPFVGIRK